MKDVIEVLIINECSRIRARVETDKFLVKRLQESIHKVVSPLNEAREEMYENAVLAYRHLEDARMRIGKVLQHLYDRQGDKKASMASEGGGKSGIGGMNEEELNKLREGVKTDVASSASEYCDEIPRGEMSDEAKEEVRKKEEMAKNAALIEAAKKKTDVASPKVSRGEAENKK
jgi:hypothetical protein